MKTKNTSLSKQDKSMPRYKNYKHRDWHRMKQFKKYQGKGKRNSH